MLPQRCLKTANKAECLFHRPIALTLRMPVNIDIRGESQAPKGVTGKLPKSCQKSEFRGCAAFGESLARKCAAFGEYPAVTPFPLPLPGPVREEGSPTCTASGVSVHLADTGIEASHMYSFTQHVFAEPLLSYQLMNMSATDQRGRR